MQYPPDAITLFHECDGPCTYQYIASNSAGYYILGYAMQQSGVASVSKLQCGTTDFAINYGKDLPYVPVQIFCKNSINFIKTGQDKVFSTFTYMDADKWLLSAQPVQINKFATSSAVAMGNFMYLVWFLGLVILFYIGFQIGTYIYKK